MGGLAASGNLSGRLGFYSRLLAAGGDLESFFLRIRMAAMPPAISMVRPRKMRSDLRKVLVMGLGNNKVGVEVRGAAHLQVSGAEETCLSLDQFRCRGGSPHWMRVESLFAGALIHYALDREDSEQETRTVKRSVRERRT